VTDQLPEIWNTTFTDHTINVRNIDFHITDGTTKRRKACAHAFLYPDGQPLTADLVPDYIFFNLQNLKEAYKAKTPDLAMISGGLFVISETFRDLLVPFDLDTTLIHEVPFYEVDQKTPRPGRWFIMHITAHKQTVIPELSENIKEVAAGSGYWRTRVAQTDVLSVRADAAIGADLLIDPHFRGRIFLSDRLKLSLKPAGIRVLRMPIRPCEVVA
jgi:hypothetical protein